MKIKIGWHRFKNKFIHSSQVHDIYMAYKYDKDNLYKVANSPQELIEVGDLVETSILAICYVQHIYKSWIETTSGRLYFHDEHITKILTPNTNGGYDLQWEERDE